MRIFSWDNVLRTSEGMDALTEKIGSWNNWLVLAMVIVSVYNAVVRYLGKYMGFNLSSNAFIELQWYLFSVIFLFGASYTLKHNSHVRVDIVYQKLSDKARTFINLLGTLFFLIPFCILVILVSTRSAIQSWAVLEGSPDPGGLPRYPLKTLVPVAFCLLLLQGISFFLKNLAHWKWKTKYTENDEATEHII